MRKGAVAWEGKVGMEGKWLIDKEFINQMGLHFSIFVRNEFEFTKVFFSIHSIIGMISDCFPL